MLSVPLLLISALATGPTEPPLLGVQDIGPIIEALDLDDDQRAIFMALIRDHGSGWILTTVVAAQQVHSGPAWDAFILAQSNWQEAQKTSRAAAEAKRTARDALMAGGPKRENAREEMAEALRTSREARDAASTARHRMGQLRKAVDPDQTRMRSALHLARAPLEAALEANIQLLLSADQLEQWPALRQRLLRARMLRSLDMPGADVDLRGRVLRQQGRGLQGVDGALAAWSTRTDASLEAIDLAMAAARIETNSTTAGALWQQVMRKQADLADLTLTTADQLALQHASLSPLARDIRRRRFPGTWRLTELHQLKAAAHKGADTQAYALAQQALHAYQQEVGPRMSEWESTEADMQLIEFACRRVPVPSDEDAFQRTKAKAAVASMHATRNKLVKHQLQWLVLQIGADRLNLVLPGLGLTAPDQAQQTGTDAGRP